MNNRSLSDESLQKVVGERLRRSRLDQNLTKQELSERSGVSPKTIFNAETGQGCTLSTLIALLRGLSRLDELDNFLPDRGLSPIALADRQGQVRQRARRKESAPSSAVWEWAAD